MTSDKFLSRYLSLITRHNLQIVELCEKIAHGCKLMHDQNFKNLILDYPVQSLEFFANEEAGMDLSQARIIPLRQEQKKPKAAHFQSIVWPAIVWIWRN